MVRKYSTKECKDIVEKIFAKRGTSSKGRNRFYLEGGHHEPMVYVSQTKPSRDSKGKWEYEFFHTLSVETMIEIIQGGGLLVLLDYINRRHILLELADILWVFQFNTRIKGEQKKWTLDIVVKELNEEFFLTSYKKEIDNKRLVKVVYA